MTTDLLLDRDRSLTGAWAEELRVGDRAFRNARFLTAEEAAALMAAGMITAKERAPDNAPPRLRDHYVCTLSGKGVKVRAELLAEEKGPTIDDLVLATGLGKGSPIHNELVTIRELLSRCAAELIAIRCSMHVAARLTGQGERFAETLEAMLRLDQEEQKK